MRSIALIRAAHRDARTIASARPAPASGSIPRRAAPRLAPALHRAAALLAVLAAASTASAQPAPTARIPAPPSAAAPAPTSASASSSASPTAPASSAPDLLAGTPNGITAEQVATRAAATSYQAKAAEESVTGATARAEGAWTNYLPRVGLTARYSRLSEFTPPTLGSGSLVVTAAPAGTPNPPSFAGGTFSFPLIFNQWLGQATIAIPISDYFLKINQGYTAATKQEEAARFDVATARAKSYSDGKIAFYTWLRARGAVVVAEQSLEVAVSHQKDAENQFSVGNASKADVLRAQTAVAGAQLAVERAKSGVVLTERQVRVAIHAKDDEKLTPGESLDGPVPTAAHDMRALVSEAHASRPEIKSVDKNATAARKLADVSRANKYPVLSGFGDLTYANPNQRRFPQRNEFFPTWAVGAQVTWSPNDFAAAGPAAADVESRAAALDAQKDIIRDGIELEVTQAYQALVEADIAVATTFRQLQSADEGYRVARELFNAGRGTATTLLDAERDLTLTRFEQLNAKVDARLARIRLDHAVARDVK